MFFFVFLAGACLLVWSRSIEDLTLLLLDLCLFTFHLMLADLLVHLFTCLVIFYDSLVLIH